MSEVSAASAFQETATLPVVAETVFSDVQETFRCTSLANYVAGVHGSEVFVPNKYDDSCAYDGSGCKLTIICRPAEEMDRKFVEISFEDIFRIDDVGIWKSETKVNCDTRVSIHMSEDGSFGIRTSDGRSAQYTDDIKHADLIERLGEKLSEVVAQITGLDPAKANAIAFRPLALA